MSGDSSGHDPSDPMLGLQPYPRAVGRAARYVYCIIHPETFDIFLPRVFKTCVYTKGGSSTSQVTRVGKGRSDT